MSGGFSSMSLLRSYYANHPTRVAPRGRKHFRNFRFVRVLGIGWPLLPGSPIDGPKGRAIRRVDVAIQTGLGGDVIRVHADASKGFWNLAPSDDTWGRRMVGTLSHAYARLAGGAAPPPDPARGTRTSRARRARRRTSNRSERRVVEICRLQCSPPKGERP